MAHDPNHPQLRSFIEVDPLSDFPIQNLPYGVFSTPQKPHQHRIATRVGDWVIDLSILAESKLLELDHTAFSRDNLNEFMSLGEPAWACARQKISELLTDSNPTLRDHGELRQKAFFRVSDVDMHLPAAIGDYTDFYSSKEHATNVGTMFRDKDNPLLPNWTHLPVAYHGRASSVVVSGTDIVRPMGQVKGPNEDHPRLSACARLDFELEMAFFVGPNNELGQAVSIDEAQQHIFGVVLMNDWSARDIQKWEYVPLGPFTAKNFATSISPWIVTMAALEPFAIDSVKQEPAPLPYLRHPDKGRFAYDVDLKVEINSANSDDWHQLCRSNAKNLYWSMSQQLAHHSISGCNLRSGDLLASGTISGNTPDSYGSMLELSWGGKNPIKIGSVERSFLEDGDTIRITGGCQNKSYRIGFGEVQGTVLPCSDAGRL